MGQRMIGVDAAAGRDRTVVIVGMAAPGGGIRVGGLFYRGGTFVPLSRPGPQDRERLENACKARA